MVYGHPKTTTTYTCTVTYSYSGAASPLAKTANGDGATPNEAVDKAKANVYGARWSPPVCSETFKASAYQKKPSYTPAQQPEGANWWVCTVEYTVSP
jgi:hypothetical protein